MLRALALADDTTGALELGAVLAAAGVEARVRLDVADMAPGGLPGLVVDTGSRRLSSTEAADRTRAAAGRHAGAYVYKKTDSTLRGNIAAELDALIQVARQPLVYVPAYPKLGRTVRGGLLLVNGVPVAETEFARDPRHPVRESSVPRLLAGGAATPAEPVAGASELSRALADRRPRVLVCDAETGEDLAALAAVWAAASPRTWVAGAAGFAPHWLSHLGLGGPVRPSPTLLPALGGVVVNGSRHPRSLEQIDSARSLLRETGCWSIFDARDLPFPAECDAATLLAARVGEHLETTPAEILILCGGDTAAAVFGALHVRELTPHGEVWPGVPLSSFDWGRRTRWAVTKAGGFGPPDLLRRLVSRA